MSYFIAITLIWGVVIHLSIVLAYHARWGKLHFPPRIESIERMKGADSESYWGYWHPRLTRFEEICAKFNEAINLMLVFNYVRGIKLYNEALEESKALEKD